METGLTILGGKGFVGSTYVEQFHDPAVGNVRSINSRHDYNVYSKDVLYFISTVDNLSMYEDPHKDIDTNLTLLVKVLENWRKREDCRDGVFNFISSWFVYGDHGCMLNTAESYPCDPYGFYSVTKRCAEQLLISYCRAHNLQYRIMRLGNVMGPGDPKVSHKKNVLQYLINRLAKWENVEIAGNGSMSRDYIHVEDCADAIDLVISRGERNSIYNIGNGTTWDMRKIMEYCHEKLKSRSRVRYGQKADLQFSLDNRKLVSLGYRPQYLEEKLFDSLCEVAVENLNSNSKCAR